MILVAEGILLGGHMSSYKDHCADCKKVLGYEYYEVHRWLDEMFKYMPGDFQHRSFRHHKNGVEECRKKWGDKGAEAAKLHIMKDFPGLAEPPDEKDYSDPKLVYKADFMMDTAENIDKIIPDIPTNIP